MGPQASPLGAWGLPIRFAIRGLAVYFHRMPSKPIEHRPRSKAFVADMRAFFAAKESLQRDEIAARQIHVLRRFPRARERPGASI